MVFQKGHPTYPGVEKGWIKKGQHLSSETEFKKGHKLSEELEKKRVESLKKTVQTKDYKEKRSRIATKLWQNPEFRENMPDKSGENNPFYGKKHTEETRKRMRENHWTKTGVIEHPFKGKKHKPKTIEKIKKTRAKQVISEETKEKLRKSFRELWRDPEYVNAVMKGRNTRPNKDELKLDSLIQRARPNEFAYNGNFSLGICIGGKIPDWWNYNGKKKVIEYFGSYWHNPTVNPKVPYERTEQGTIEHYANYGIKCLIIWDNELKNQDNIIQKIQNFMEE